MASRSVIFEDQTEAYVSVYVQFKIAGIDLESLKSDGKVFRVGGKEYPTWRYGTWAIQGVQDREELASNLMDGGIAVAITWGMVKQYPKISIWMENIRERRFTFDMPKSEQKHILSEIGSGKMAKNVEKSLRELQNPDVYKSIKIKLIKIITEISADKRTTEDEPTSHIWDKPRMQRLVEAEKVANMMQDGNFSWAFLALKQALAQEKNKPAILQMTVRLCICAIHLNNTRELEESFPRILHLVQKANILSEEVTFYLKDANQLFVALISCQSAIRAIELLLAFNEVAKKIPDVEERVDRLSVHLSRIGTAMRVLLGTDPAVCLKSQILTYVKKVESEIEFMRRQTGCDSMLQARCVYYAEYTLAELKIGLKPKVEGIYSESTVEFNSMRSCWADFPFVITRLKMHPEVSAYLENEEFIKDLKEISENPSLLQRKIKDPKIARANEVLTSGFGLINQDKDLKNLVETIWSGAGRFGSASASERTEQKPIDKKLEAQKEKEKGNEAYKRKQFTIAHSHYDKAIGFDPSDAMLHSNKAAVYISEDKLNMARAACLAAINLTQNSSRHDDKDVAKIIARLARVEFLDKRFDVAITLYRRSLRLNSDPKVQEKMKECEEMILGLRFMSSMRFPF